MIEEIEFKDVTFTYPGSKHAVLKGMNLHICANETYALVGRNGSGKTTIINLLTGLYTEYSGEILLNGRELRSYNFEQLANCFSIVHQDFAKYPLSLFDNIAIGDLEHIDE